MMLDRFECDETRAICNECQECLSKQGVSCRWIEKTRAFCPWITKADNSLSYARKKLTDAKHSQLTLDFWRK